MQKHFKYLVVILIAMATIRAESEGALYRKGCCGKFKKAIVSGLLTAGTLDVTGDATVDGILTVNDGAVITAAGNSLTVNSTCVNVSGCFNVNGSPVVAVPGPLILDQYFLTTNPSQFSNVNNCSQIAVTSSFQTIDYGTFNQNTLNLSINLQATNTLTSPSFTLLNVTNGQPFANWANAAPVNLVMMWQSITGLIVGTSFAQAFFINPTDLQINIYPSVPAGAVGENSNLSDISIIWTS